MGTGVLLFADFGERAVEDEFVEELSLLLGETRGSLDAKIGLAQSVHRLLFRL
jgi:hypothetical protein